MKEIFLAVLSLVGVLALIFVTFFVARWLSKRMYGIAGRHIRVVEREMLSQDKSLVVVKAGERYMLLGVTGEHIDKLCDFSEEEASLFDEPAPSNANGTFLDNLKKATAEHPYVKPFVKNKEHSHADEDKDE